MSTSSNSPYHHGNLRQALLEAALIILEKEGEAGLGLRDLARAVGHRVCEHAVETDGGERLLGDFTFNHTRTIPGPPAW